MNTNTNSWLMGGSHAASIIRQSIIIAGTVATTAAAWFASIHLEG